MWHVNVDAISVKELSLLCKTVNCDVWRDAKFDTKQEAEEFAQRCREIVPLAWVEVAI